MNRVNSFQELTNLTISSATELLEIIDTGDDRPNKTGAKTTDFIIKEVLGWKLEHRTPDRLFTSEGISKLRTQGYDRYLMLSNIHSSAIFVVLGNGGLQTLRGFPSFFLWVF